MRTIRVHNYKTKIRGYPFVVEKALIGRCNYCQAESFAPEETKRWEDAFFHTLETRHAFLSPQEILELRTVLGLSMEDFARLIGCTRQSVLAWEKADRSIPPSRMADVLMKLVRESLVDGQVDVLKVLLDEAQKWGVVIELRRPPRTQRIVVPVKKKVGEATS
jgi:DNA-binding transcriptional regulator YiaG